jgi:hypothetical protein
MNSFWPGNWGPSSNNINAPQRSSMQNQPYSNILQNSAVNPYGFLYQNGNRLTHPPYFNPLMLPFMNFGSSN